MSMRHILSFTVKFANIRLFNISMYLSVQEMVFASSDFNMLLNAM